MAYEAKVVEASVGLNRVQITTFETTFPRIILAEFNTHRDFSRNSASSRAIPIKKVIAAVEENPYIPVFLRDKAGMQGVREDDQDWQEEQKREYLLARDECVYRAKRMLANGVSKGDANRILEAYMWHTAIVTSTRWSNFFAQRLELDDKGEPLAHLAIYTISKMMKGLLDTSTPQFLHPGRWHLPYITDEDRGCTDDYQTLAMASAGRCAGVSYLRHGEEKPFSEAVALSARLTKMGHWSPLEHQAMAMDDANGDYQSGNLRGWVQFRHTYKGECR